MYLIQGEADGTWCLTIIRAGWSNLTE